MKILMEFFEKLLQILIFLIKNNGKNLEKKENFLISLQNILKI